MVRKILFLLTAGFYGLNLFAQVAYSGVNWVNWHNEPLTVTENSGYANNPIEPPVINALRVSDSWEYNPLGDEGYFESTWDLAGEEHDIANLTSNGIAGDYFDLNGEQTFGASFKVMHDGEKMYVLFKYLDKEKIADSDGRYFELFTQPGSSQRHELSFQSASDSTNAVIAYQNMAYARIVELGGAKAVFKSGQVIDVQATLGLNKYYHGSRGYFAAQWGENKYAKASYEEGNHYWNTDNEGTIRAILVVPFDGALAKPMDPWNIELSGDFIPTQPGDTIIFDVNSRAYKGEISIDNRIEYFWSAKHFYGYASNYYSGKLILQGSGKPFVQSPVVYCVNSEALPLTANGANLKWYTTPGGAYVTTPPVPATNEAGTTTYYVTQTLNDEESEYSEIEVIVKPLQEEADPIQLAKVEYGINSKKNMIYWQYQTNDYIDSLFLIRKIIGSSDEADTIKRLNYSWTFSEVADDSADTWSNYQYCLVTKNICGYVSNSHDETSFHRPVQLTGNFTDSTYRLTWNEYAGRDVIEYQLLRVDSDEKMQTVYTGTKLFFSDLNQSHDSVPYIVKAVFNNEFENQILNNVNSNSIKLAPNRTPVYDTIKVYDTIFVYHNIDVYDTVKVSITDTLIVNLKLSSTPGIEFSKLKIYPNPVKDKLIIEIDQLVNEINFYQVRIIDNLGKSIFFSYLTSTEIVIDSEIFKGPGLYYIQISNSQNKIIELRKLIVEQ